MIAAEVIALIALIIAGVAAVRLVWSWSRLNEAIGRTALRRREQMREDLRVALLSSDYHKLDDFVAVWSIDLDKETMKYVKQRRDELFVDANQ